MKGESENNRIAKMVYVEVWVSNEASLEESDVENGRVEINELEDEHFEREVVLELCLRPMHFCGRKDWYISTWMGSVYLSVQLSLSLSDTHTHFLSHFLILF